MIATKKMTRFVILYLLFQKLVLRRTVESCEGVWGAVPSVRRQMESAVSCFEGLYTPGLVTKAIFICFIVQFKTDNVLEPIVRERSRIVVKGALC